MKGLLGTAPAVGDVVWLEFPAKPALGLPNGLAFC